MSDEDLKTQDAPEADGADPAPEAAEATEAPETRTGLGAELDAPESTEEAPSTEGPLGDEDTAEAEEAPIEKLGDTPDDTRKVEVPADWPSDWRAKMAGGDEKLMKRLERFSDPTKVLNSWLSAEQKISSGEYKKELGADASPEDLAAWRKEHGVPDGADGYKLPEDHEWSEADNELFGTIFEHMHETNATQEQINALASGYQEILGTIREQQAQAEREFIQSQEDVLRTRLGDDYRPRIKLYEWALTNENSPVPEVVRETLASARLENGGRLTDNAEIAGWIMDMAYEVRGEGSLETGSSSAAQTRASEIQNIMRTDFDRYIREGLDQEYTRILDKQNGRRPMGGSDYGYDD